MLLDKRSARRMPDAGQTEYLLSGFSVHTLQLLVLTRVHAGHIPTTGSIFASSVGFEMKPVDDPIQLLQLVPACTATFPKHAHDGASTAVDDILQCLRWNMLGLWGESPRRQSRTQKQRKTRHREDGT